MTFLFLRLFVNRLLTVLTYRPMWLELTGVFNVKLR